jgi:carnitine-CoA ligase
MIDTEDAVIRLFVALAEQHPERLYARFEGTPLTFGRLHAQSNCVAARLRAAGVMQGDRVAVMLQNTPATLAVLLGLAKAGAIWVPVNVALRGDGLRYILQHAEPSMTIVETALLARIQESGAALRPKPVVRSEDLAAWLETDHDFTEALPQADDTFAIMYTSGTTGRPKGVMVSHRMLRLAGEAAALVSTARDGDVMFMWEPLYHIGGAQMLVLPLLHRVALAMVERFSASRFWQQVRAEGASHIHFLGGILQILLKQPSTELDRRHGVRVAWGGGCPAEIWRAFEERFGVQIRECYGMTEASSVTTYNNGGPVGSVGKPLPWFSVSVQDPAGRAVPAGARGEIIVRPNLPGAITRGYFRDPEATALALHDGALRTGDVGSLDAAGNMTFHGRLSDSVRCRGENVSAFEVEQVAAGHPIVEECAMIAVAAEIGEQEIKLFLKPKPGATIDLAELSAWLSERLAPYQNPRYLALIEEFERTPSLRIMKHRLSKDVSSCFDRQRSPPRPPCAGGADSRSEPGAGATESPP